MQFVNAHPPFTQQICLQELLRGRREGITFETIVKAKIMNFLEINHLIYNSQHGFRSRRSCLTNLLEFYEDVLQHDDEGRPVDVIFLDFQKAFDKVLHMRLLEKIKAHGIGGKILTWIEK